MGVWVLRSKFAPKTATTKTEEILNLEAEAMAGVLGVPDAVDRVREGVFQKDHDHLVEIVTAHSKQHDLLSQAKDLQEGKSLWRFLGQQAVENRQEKLRNQALRLGGKLDAASWFYQQPRVWLLSLIRDAALDSSRHTDADWEEIDPEQVELSPCTPMLMGRDPVVAKEYATVCAASLKQIDPMFLLNKFDGHRSLRFDFEKSEVLYFASVKQSGGEIRR